MVVLEEEEEGETEFFRVFVEFRFRSKIEDVLDGKGEVPGEKGEVEGREGEEKEADNDDDLDDAEVDDSRSTNSTNESR